MEREKRQIALTELLSQAESKGYILFDDIMLAAETFSLPLPDFDWLTEAITSRGVLIYDEAPNSSHEYDEDDEVADFAQVDYDYIYSRVLELDPTLEIIISEIRKIKPPQLHEVGQLKYLVKEGNLHARERLIEMHLRNAVRLALQRSETFDYPIDEALQFAFIGLISAVDKYDPDINGTFASYANLYMVQSILRDQPTQNACLYYPVHRKESLFAVYPDLKKAGALECCADYTQAIDIIMDKLNCEQDNAESILYSALPSLSLESQYEVFLENIFVFEKHEKDISTHPFYSAFSYDDMDDIDEALDQQSMRAYLHEMFCKLSEREQKVLYLRYGIDDGIEHTLAEVGDILLITRERVRQIETKAITKLQSYSRFIRKTSG